jgi:nicotinamide riboside kinase
MEENLKQQPTAILKIAVFGPERTGKSTLAKQLAEHYNTGWASEFAQDYWQQKEGHQQNNAPEDLMPIAIGHTKRENDGVAVANTYFFSDSCLLATKVFSERYFQFCDPILDKAARKHQYDLFFLTDVDVPLSLDDLWDYPTDRLENFNTYRKALIDHKKPYITISGDAETRLKKAIAIIEELTMAKKNGFSSDDFLQIFSYGIPIKSIENQLHFFKTGIPKAILERPAIVRDGVLKLSDQQFQDFVNRFEAEKGNLTLQKFVPASGAASRMFQFLIAFLNDFDITTETINAYINRKKENDLVVFLAGMEKLPFYKSIRRKIKEANPDYDAWGQDEKRFAFIKTMVSSDYFDFASKPKGILPFHKYKAHLATPVEEHFKEAILYATANNQSQLHFTISATHQNQFEELVNEIKSNMESELASAIQVDFSYQKSATDTLAVTLDNAPFRDEKGQLVFRPGGHGALIENLNALDADIIFIKNIDNVIQNRTETVALYKKALAGVLMKLQTQVFNYLQDIKRLNQDDIEEIITFVKNKLNTEVIEDFSKYTLENKINYLSALLNRPIRVCGMVKNEGEPGGGPFWVRDSKGNLTLQIVESSQVDLQNPQQVDLLNQATHFNPVDLVCGIKNYQGEKFDLTQFVDHKSGFIVQKNKNGKPLKAYELPGLWNGAMANWITVFVEVPLITFNPVKTVNDLLKPAHQP